jgi:hypothetical protein
MVAGRLAVFSGPSLVMFLKTGKKGICHGQASSSLAASLESLLFDNSLHSGSGLMPSRFRKPRFVVL